MSMPTYRLIETAPPLAEPLSLAEMKTFLRVDHGGDDLILSDLILAARQFAEKVTGRSLIQRSYSLFIDHWPGTTSLGWWDGLQEGADIIIRNSELILPMPPAVSVTRVNIYDANNAATEFTASNYFVDTISDPARLILKAGVFPPVPGRDANGIEVQYKAGYGTNGKDVPMPLRQGLKQIVAHLYTFRGDTPYQALSASGAAAFFAPYRKATVA